MDVVEMLTSRNADYAPHRYTPGLRMMPSLRTIVIGCVDPRVEPTAVLGVEQGEVATIRNVGGRVTPATLRELAMLRKVTQAAGGDLGPGWDVVVLQHTDCGITRLDGELDMLSGYFDVDTDHVAAQAVTDPRRAVALDVDTLRAQPGLTGVRVSGLVYDVATGEVDVVTTS